MTICTSCGRENRREATFCDCCGARLGARPSDAARAPPILAGGELFVGRERELETLAVALDQAITGSGGRIAMLAGEPGIGKTRTAQIIAKHAERRNVCVLWGRCHEEPGAPPYWPWLQTLRGWLDAQEQDGLEAILGDAANVIAEIVPEIGLRLAALAPLPPTIDAAQARFRLFDAIGGFWKRAAAATPLLLILDNLHWADTASLRLLEFLAPEIGGSRLLFIGTYRDIELSRQHPLSSTLAELARHPRFERLRMTGLSRDETSRFITDAAGQSPPPELLQNVHSQTEGNPLFVVEMTRFLLQEGMLGTGSGTSGVAVRPGLRRIPEGIREVIGRRLNRLSPQCNRVLEAAAIIGRSFELRVLISLLDDLAEDQCSAALEEAGGARVIEEQGTAGVYQFSHALIRETLYAEVPRLKRMRFHLRIGAALEALHASDVTTCLSALAHHYGAALPGGDAGKTVEYARRAAEQAEKLLAYEEASQYYRLALAALDVKGSAQARCKLLIALGEALTKAGETLQALETFEQAAAAAKALGDTEALARAAMGYEDASWRPGLPGEAAARLLRQALAELGERDSVVKARVLSSLTRALLFSGAADEAMKVNEHAVAMARRLGEVATLATALRAGLTAFAEPHRLATRMAVALEAVRLAEQCGDNERALEAASTRMFGLMQLGDTRMLAAELEAFTRKAEALRQPFYQYLPETCRASMALFEGRFTQSEQFAQSALQIGRRMPGLDAAGIYGVQMFTLRREQGRLRDLAPLVSQFVQMNPQASTWRPGLAVTYAELGFEDRARAEFEALAVEDFAGIPRDALWVTCVGYLADVCTFLGDANRAPTLYSFLEPYDGHNLVAGPHVACYGAAARNLGMLAATMQRWDDAERHFESAVEMNSRQRARPWLAHTQYEYAVMLLARKRPADRALAVKRLEGALATSLELGMQALTERIERLRQPAQGAPGKPRFPAGLSAREVEVLRLLAAGNGNREIAALLFVSPNTVANHVRSILTKTNTGNRTQAAAFASRNGLVAE
jgi:DNA-binding CsgD family transcriptional regulator/tetratricopeptide (TPR) repeat protein